MNFAASGFVHLFAGLGRCDEIGLLASYGSVHNCEYLD